MVTARLRPSLNSVNFQLNRKHGRRHRAYFHHGQARRRSAWSGRQNHQALRTEGLQARRSQVRVGKWISAMLTLGTLVLVSLLACGLGI